MRDRRVSFGINGQPERALRKVITLHALSFGIDDPVVFDSGSAYRLDLTPRSTLRVEGERISTTSSGGFSVPRLEM